ncbi:MAG: hypothetical protein GYA35_06115, partial [Thermoanaerobaculaceae bacterium]|nr:hypothetical protein [Thermoanaerobaculaceae bacterium]
MGTFKTFLLFVLNALKPVSLFVATTLLMTLAIIFMGASVWGATINVTPNAPDVLNGNDCSCSLREAIININDGMTTYADCAPIGSYGNDDTIIIPSGTYTISTTSYNIANNVSIIGAGAGITIIDGNWLDRVFVVGNYSVFISDITITRGGKFQNNGGGGGAIYNSGTLTITNSTVSDSAFHGDNTCGGGIYNNGTLTITNSTITENWASGWWGCGGGGIFNNTDSILVVTNSTISNNKADGYYNTGGGGILNYGTLTVSSSTISGNTETANPSSDGGGILNYGTATFSNTIVANQLIGADCTGSITSNGFNLESSTSCGFTNTGDMQNTDPLLGPLQYNGGQTLTMALLYGSPAIDAGSCEQITDQRGIARPQGKTFDIGAYEYAVCTPPSGMVAWWKADGNANDSVGTNHGTLNNGATIAPGMVKQAFRLDGINDYISTPDSSIFDFGINDFTIDSWINTATPSSTMRLIAAGSWEDGVY